MRALIMLAILAAVASCSKSPVTSSAPYSVLYSNQSSNVNSGAPGTFTVTWLSAGTIGDRQTELILCAQKAPDCPPTWYGPGFRTDVVQPGAQMCVHFTGPSDGIAVEWRATFPGGAQGSQFAPGQPDPTWSTSSSWGFNGKGIGPAGASDGSGGVLQGC